MSKKQKNPTRPSQAILHPGSSDADAKAVGGSGDFGVSESDATERAYTSENTKRSDRNAVAPRSESGGQRVSGAGGNNSGPGSSSGGDLDPDIIGFGTGGVAASGKIHEPSGPDDATGTSRDFASGAPAAKNPRPYDIGGTVTGSTVQPPDDRTVGPAGADAVSRPETDDDDSFSGEISSGEASGRDDAGV